MELAAVAKVAAAELAAWSAARAMELAAVAKVAAAELAAWSAARATK
jgi:hypothetical protein